jgi:hypothetical protein
MTKTSCIVPPEIRELLGPPTLLSTENPDLYWRMFSEIAQAVRPKDLLDWLHVRTLTL